MFPFIYKDVEYSTCTDKNHDAQWCATKTDVEGKFINDEWGNCDVGCPGFRGIEPKFDLHRSLVYNRLGSICHQLKKMSMFYKLRHQHIFYGILHNYSQFLALYLLHISRDRTQCKLFISQ